MAAARVYTDRLIASDRVRQNVMWECPEGYRTVVTNISVMCWGPVNSSVVVSMHGFVSFWLAFPVAPQSASRELRVVLYQRETLTIYQDADNMTTVITGYVFKDPDGRPDYVTGGTPIIRPVPSNELPPVKEAT